MKTPNKTFREVNPEGAKMWAYDLNGYLTPDNVGAASKHVVWFRCCDNPKHLFQRKISRATSPRDGHNIGCKYCGPNAKEAFPGETDLFTVCPEAKEFWDFEQNDLLGLVPTKLKAKSNKKAHFKCKHGHDEFKSIQNFVNSPECQTCKISLLINAPITAEFLNTKYNTTEDLISYVKSDRRLLELKCGNCNYTWSWTAHLWYERQYCPHCGFDGTEGSCERNSFVKDEYHILTFRDANPQMAEFWDYEKNGDFTPDNVATKLSTEFYFKCDAGHEYRIALKNLYRNRMEPHGCPLCIGKKDFIQAGINDFFTIVPIAKELWDYENNELDPTTLSANSGIEVNFKCQEGHSFRRKITYFTKYPQCPTCYATSNAYKYNIKNLRPESYRFWDFDKNILDPDITSPYLEELAFWKCPDCGYEWKQKISDRCSSRAGKCPSHDLKRVFSDTAKLKIEDSFQYKNPEASKYWNLELSNGMTPANTPKASAKEIYMNCSRGKHEPYPIPVHEIYILPYKCPGCTKDDEEENYRRTSLICNVEDIHEYWDYENNDMKLEDAKIYMSESANFICKEGHRFRKQIRNFVSNTECPVCTLDTVVKYPHLVKQWDFKKNKAFDINMTSANSSHVVHWRCKKCGYEWTAEIASRKVSVGRCPCCEERTVVAKGITDLFTMVPNSVDYYDFDANTHIDADNLSVTSLTVVGWVCPKCEYRWKTSVSSRVERLDDGSYKLRGCPACIGLVRTKSYGEEYPDLEKRFIEELNGCSLRDVYSSKIAKNKFIWKCELCERNFESSIISMVNARNSATKGCLYCSGRVVLRENSFAALHPEVLDEYDPDNEIDPFTVTEKSSKQAAWICGNNSDHRWKSSFGARAAGVGGCPICKQYNYAVMFSDNFPELEAFYDIDKNTRPYSSYSLRSNEIVWWKCDAGHSFQREFSYIAITQELRCPVCTGRTIVEGENDLLTEYPELRSIWDYEKNEVNPTTLSSKTRGSYYFTCEKHHSYRSTIDTLVDHNFRCYVCDNIVVQVGFNSLLDTDKELCKEISPNETRKPTEFTKDSAYSMLWKCPTCTGEYHAEIRERFVGDDSCPYCNNRRALAGFNSLDVYVDNIADVWNADNDKHYSKILPTSNYMAKWDCVDCGHTYSESVNTFVKIHLAGEGDCPYCNNRRTLAGFNSLDVYIKDIADIWNKDNEKDYTELLPSGQYLAKWNCTVCGGCYPETVSSFVEKHLKGEDDCPYCNNRKVLPGFNSLKATDLEFFHEWSYQNNYLICDPDEILPTYNEDVWWSCNKCNSEYLMSPKNRGIFAMRKKIACPKCKGLRRKKKYFF